MVEPAWAAADTAISGSSSEVERRRFVNIVRLLFIAEAHHLRFPNEFGANRQPVTSSRRRESAEYVPLIENLPPDVPSRRISSAVRPLASTSRAGLFEAC